jgi:membrane dipeptidase
MRLSWRDLGTARAERAHGKTVELSGFALSLLPGTRGDYFVMMAEPGCCAGCVPANKLAVVEVFAKEPLKLDGKLQLSGTWHVSGDEDGWRYQLRAATTKPGVSRRALLAASPLFCLPVPTFAQANLNGVDLHSHAGKLLNVKSNPDFPPVAAPMRQGGMAAICLAIVPDSPTSQYAEGRIRPFRNPNPGELYQYATASFQRLHRLVREQGLGIIRTAAELRAATAAQPSVIVSSEGGDFLEGRLERLDEAYDRWGLRHLQLTHYRPNELGDIQTEPSEKGGLTAFGADVIRRCNQRGIVVDVAHGTFDLVKAAAKIATKPLVLSHTSLTERPSNWTRLIVPDHARVVASTRGVIGIWPVKQIFGTFAAWAQGIARMADVVGVDHVGVGTDLLGLPGGSTIADYNEMPQLAAALSGRFNPAEVAKIMGGNYRRVFDASLPA